ncbi:MAG: type IV pilus assembly protein PilM [Candidatus Pacebacteria bacterium]|nr:type IV pilus assembly protein PilM [Candidatus Paceibacterota bacterium]
MLNPFSKLSNISFLKHKSDSFLGLDIGSSSIKVVQLKKKNGVVILETYGELSLGPYANIEAGRATNLSSAQLSEAIINLLKEANVTTKECGVSIPLKSSLVFNIELPTMDRKQLEQMIPIEARKYIPVPISEVDLDWKIIPKEEMAVTSFMGDENNGRKEETPKTEVLVAAIHRDTVLKQKEVVNGAGLNLNFLEIEIFSTIRTAVSHNILNFAVLDMGSGSTKLYIIEKGMIRDSHSISRGSQDITLNIARATGISATDAEQQKIKVGVIGNTPTEKEVSDIVYSSMEYIFGEVNKTFLAYQKKYNKNVDKLVITGGGSIINGMTEFAKSHTEIEVEISDPFSKVEAPAFLAPLLKQVGPGFAVALGLALRGLQQME